MNSKLREIRMQPYEQDGQQGILLSDAMGISDKLLWVPGPLAILLLLMDGTRDIDGLKAGFELRTGQTINETIIEQFVDKLDEALFLDTDNFRDAYQSILREYRTSPCRMPASAGLSYPDKMEDLKKQLNAYCSAVPEQEHIPSTIRGLICPHIDYNRGNRVYAETWQTVRNAVKKADTFIILGTDHKNGNGNITLTRQNYRTPLGQANTHVEIVDGLADILGSTAFDNELNHLMEHSIELALVWLQHCMREREFRIVPVLCGAFLPFYFTHQSPSDARHIAATARFLGELGEDMRTIIIAAADLAHSGLEFGDITRLDEAGIEVMKEKDEKLLSVMRTGDPEKVFTEVDAEEDSRHICGIPPVYLMLSALGNSTGTLINYAQCPTSPDGSSQVSVCGMYFE